ncbi:tetratricopeptide repeat protein [Streptomyces luteolifulvus]|uniref:tetratricopeptide repeat protein n=1 Tax=Streptomyces luteolifulvus TaxID=2615112 RepID=UPI0012490FC2|nr:tetratricopeptide repeat protein [Streptomyces luteolifulvus]
MGAWFTDREAALKAVHRLLNGPGNERVLLLHGVSGTGKSTVLDRLQSRPPARWRPVLVDAAALVPGMVVPDEGGEEAALALLRLMARGMADQTSWWRRRWVRQRADAIGVVRPWSVQLWQWAGMGGTITESPVTVSGAHVTQSERRTEWVRELQVVARAVRRRRVLLLVDTCEQLVFFDDVHGEQPRSGRPFGVGGWFLGVLEELIPRVPELRVVMAGSTRSLVDQAGRSGRAAGRYVVHELSPWTESDTCTYLTRRGLTRAAQLAGPVVGAGAGMPAVISWIADVLTRTLGGGHAGTADDGAAEEDVLSVAHELTSATRQTWLREHVLRRVSERVRRLLQAAAVLGTFTEQALFTVAFGPDSLPDPGDDWFSRIAGMSCLRQLPDANDVWRMHATIRAWLLETLTEDDTRRTPTQKTLPGLHEAAALYYEALVDGDFSPQAAHHRFALGQDTHAASWTSHLGRALTADPVDALHAQALTDAALTAPRLEHTLPQVAAEAHFARAYVAHLRDDDTVAQHHAEQALALFEKAQPQRSERACTAARLAGQSAWRRRRFAEAAAHWTSALTHHPEADTEAELRCALAGAVLHTGDLARAQDLLERALQAVDHASVGTPTSAAPEVVTPSGVLPPIALADHLADRERRAHILVESAVCAFRRAEGDQAQEYAARALEQATGDPHHTALANDIAARIALHSWNVPRADRLVEEGLTAARACSDPRCMIQLLLTQADLAERHAVWTSPDKLVDRPASVSPAPGVGVDGSRSVVVVTSSTSVTQRVEALRRRALAKDLRGEAHALALQLQDDHVLAVVLYEQDAAEALRLHRLSGDRTGQVGALLALEKSARRRGDFNEALAHATEALALSRATGYRSREAPIMQRLGANLSRIGEVEQAEQYYADALDLFRTTADRHGEASALRGNGVHQRIRGNLARSDDFALQGLGLSRSLGDRSGMAESLHDLGESAYARGDIDDAHRYALEAFHLYRSTASEDEEAHALQDLSRVAYDRDGPEQARRHLIDALKMARAAGDRHRETHVLYRLGIIATRIGRLEEARRHLTQGLALSRDNGESNGIAEGLYRLGIVALSRRDLEYAQRSLTEALALFGELADRHGEAGSRRMLAEVALRRGDLPLAERYVTRALTAYRDMGDRRGEADSLHCLAHIAIEHRDTSAAHRHLTRAAELYEAVQQHDSARLCRRSLREL